MSVHMQPGVFEAPAIASRVVQFYNNGFTKPVVIVENLDPAVGGSSAAVRLQESDNGVDWTDVPDTSSTIMPGGESVLIVASSGRARLALHAGGNVSLLVSIIRTIKGSPTDLGAA